MKAPSATTPEARTALSAKPMYYALTQSVWLFISPEISVVSSPKKRKSEKIVGAAVAEVSSRTNEYWFQQSHLLRLNLLLLVPLLSSSIVRYDGMLHLSCNP